MSFVLCTQTIRSLSRPEDGAKSLRLTPPLRPSLLELPQSHRPSSPALPSLAGTLRWLSLNRYPWHFYRAEATDKTRCILRLSCCPTSLPVCLGRPMRYGQKSGRPVPTDRQSYH